MNVLPQGWIETQLESLVDILDSARKPVNASERERRVKGKPPNELFPYYGATGQVGVIDESIFDEPLILLGEDGVPFFDCFRHKSYLIEGKSWVNNHAHVLRAINGVVDRRYLAAHLNVFDYTGYVTGTTRLKLTQEAMRSIPILVAPIAEQHRIADKLDALLGRVDACHERLDRVPVMLKRFRQAVLAAATSAELTREWRETRELGEWQEVDLERVALDFSYGTSAKSNQVGKVPVLRMGNIQDGLLDWDDLVFTSDENEIKKYRLVPGDVIFNRTNSPELVGKTAVFRGEREAIYAGYLIRVRCSDDILPDYLNYCLNSPAGRDYCWQVKSDGVSQSNINARKLAAFEFLLPTIAEQQEVVRRVEELFAMGRALESSTQAALRKIEFLTPSVLSQAFRGKLVSQDPNDEPASELLKRIRGEQTEANLAPHRKRGRPRGSQLKPKLETDMQNRPEVTLTHLSSILRERGPMTAEALWTASKLEIDEFYEQLKHEDEHGLLHEIRGSEPYIPRLLEAVA